MTENQIKKEILLIEDDKSIGRFILVSLKTTDYKCSHALNGSGGISLFYSNKPDLVLLDLGLPDIDGMDVLVKIREISKTPIIVVSARDSEKDIVEALDLGADDYITKPFRPGELLARIRAAFRKQKISSETDLEKIFSYQGLVIDFDKRYVTVDSNVIHLTPTEYNLLCTLVLNKGKVLTHRYLSEKVWGHVAVDDFQYVRVTMANLRRKIENDSATPCYILTETGVGYRFRDD